jgi:hypothetical protein
MIKWQWRGDGNEPQTKTFVIREKKAEWICKENDTNKLDTDTDTD